MRRRRAHLSDGAARAGLPLGHSRRGGSATDTAPPAPMSRTHRPRLLALAFAGATALAELLGAVNMGTALTFGELAFAATLIWVLLRPSGAL